MRPPPRTVRRAAGFGFLLLATSELTLRLSGFAEPHLYDPIYAPYPGSAEIPYVHKPGLKDARGRGSSRVSTDALGLRCVEPGRRYPAKRPGELRIAVVGDSGTFGEGVARTQDTYVHLIEELLSPRLGGGRTARTFNFGVSAYSVREMAATLEHRMPLVEPDWVVMVIIPHDLALVRTPVVDGAGYLVDPRPGAVGPRPASRLSRALRLVHLSYLLRDIQRRIGSPGRSVMEQLAAGGVPDSYAYLRRFRALADAAGRRHLVVLRPSFARQPIPGLRAALERDGITSLDLTPLRDEFSDQEFRSSRFDVHPSARVHRRIAEALADYFAGELAGAGHGGPGLTGRAAADAARWR